MMEFTVHKSLKLAVITEQLGAKFYEKMAMRFSDVPEVGAIFAQLARDEVSHENHFKQLLEKTPDDPISGDFETHMVLRSTAISEFFRQDALKEMEDVKTPVDALYKAVALEKSTLFYYMSLREVLGAHEQLDALIKAEKSHVAALMKTLMTQSEFRGLADPWA